LAAAWLVAAVVSAVFGLLQYTGLAIYASPWVNEVGLGQAYANLRQRNQLATLLSIGLIAAISLHTKKRAVCVPFNIIIGLAVALLAAANSATGSRTGLFQFAMVILVFSFWKRGGAALAVAVLTYLLTAWLLPIGAGLDPMVSGILGRTGETMLSCTSRLTLWSNVLHLVAQKPWTGWGWGELDYAHFITSYSGERFCEILDNAHNLPLHLAVELGIPVAAVFCGGCAWMIWRNKPWAETDPTRQLAWGVLAVIGLHSMLEYPLWYGPFQLAVVLCIWLLWRGPEADAAPLSGSRFAFATGAAAVALLALCAYVAWDYWRISQIYLPPASRHAAYREDTLAKVQGSQLFRDQVQFAELTLTPLDEDNVVYIHALAKDMLHFSPEPRVVEKVIESAVMLHQDAEALFYLQRYKAAFPTQHARWSVALKTPE
jgi:O-antigen ligase